MVEFVQIGQVTVASVQQARITPVQEQNTLTAECNALIGFIDTLQARAEAQIL